MTKAAKPGMEAFIQKRIQARRMVFLSIYASLMADQATKLSDQEAMAEQPWDKSYARKLYGLYNDHREAIMAQVDQHIQMKQTHSCTPIERALMLMAATELLYIPSTPGRLVCHDAIELAKSYGSEGGYRLVNAVLDKLLPQNTQKSVYQEAASELPQSGDVMPQAEDAHADTADDSVVESASVENDQPVKNSLDHGMNSELGSASVVQVIPNESAYEQSQHEGSHLEVVADSGSFSAATDPNKLEKSSGDDGLTAVTDPKDHKKSSGDDRPTAAIINQDLKKSSADDRPSAATTDQEAKDASNDASFTSTAGGPKKPTDSSADARAKVAKSQHHDQGRQNPSPDQTAPEE